MRFWTCWKALVLDYMCTNFWMDWPDSCGDNSVQRWGIKVGPNWSMLVQKAGWTKKPWNLTVLRDLSVFLTYFFVWSNGPSCFPENLYIFVVHKIFWDFLLGPSDR